MWNGVLKVLTPYNVICLLLTTAVVLALNGSPLSRSVDWLIVGTEDELSYFELLLPDLQGLLNVKIPNSVQK